MPPHFGGTSDRQRRAQRLDRVATRPDTPTPRRGAFRQAATLASRQLHLLVADRSYAAFSLLLPFVLAALSLAVPGDFGLSRPSEPTSEAMQLLVIVIVGATFMGTASSIREVVGERGIYARERAVGLRPEAYLIAKTVVFALLSTVQSAVLVGLVLLGKPGPQDALLLPSAGFELVVVTSLVTWISALVGLAISSMVSSSEQVMPLLVVSIMAQLVLCGGLVPITGRAVLEQLAWLAPARWGYAAAASSVDLRALAATAPQDAMWNHEVGNLILVCSVLALIGVISTVVIWLRLHQAGRPIRTVQYRRSTAPGRR